MANESKPLRIELSPEGIELSPGTIQAFTLKEFDADGRPVQISKASWSATGGKVDASGLFTGGNEDGQFSVDVELFVYVASVVVITETVTPPHHEAPITSGSTAAEEIPGSRSSSIPKGCPSREATLEVGRPGGRKSLCPVKALPLGRGWPE